MPTFVLFHEPGPGWQHDLPYPEQPGIEAHVAFARRLVDEGHLLLGGPFTDDASGGMFVIRADSLEQAVTLAHEDASIGGLLRVRVRPWRVAMSTVELGPT